jgi:pimeloyl-ACP methyl ester carboxylesterase
MDIVLVHGAFHGGWCWAHTAKLLSEKGARVFTPTLTGLADRKHMLSPSVNLATHVTDIVNLIEYEKLDGCVLVGHSYAGNVLSGVGDQLRDRISHYIFVDAAVPPNGSTTWGWASLNPARVPWMMEQMDGAGNGMFIPPFPAERFGLTDPRQIADVNERLTPMPRGTFTETIELRNRGTEGLKRSYLAAADPWYENMASTVEWVSKDPEWTFRSIDTCHDMMVTRPEETAQIIWDLASA